MWWVSICQLSLFVTNLLWNRYRDRNFSFVSNSQRTEDAPLLTYLLPTCHVSLLTFCVLDCFEELFKEIMFWNSGYLTWILTWTFHCKPGPWWCTGPGYQAILHVYIYIYMYVYIFTPQPFGLEGYCRHGSGGRAGGCQTCGTHISVKPLDGFSPFEVLWNCLGL